jgi:flavodoxin
MKSLIVYYSLSGNTELIATELASALNATILRLKPVKELDSGKFSTYMWGGMQAKMSQTPELEPYSVSIEDFDLILLGSPVWAWTLAPPIRSFVEKEKTRLHSKPLALFMSAGGDGIKAMQRFQAYLKGFQVGKTIMFHEPKLRHTPEQVQKAKDWAKSL